MSLSASVGGKGYCTIFPPSCRFQLTKVKVLTSQQGQSCVLYSTPTSLTLHPLHPLHSPLAPPTQILDSIAGGGATCLTCFEANREMSTVACGTSAFGYQVSKGLADRLWQCLVL